jgi:hypothetical protein
MNRTGFIIGGLVLWAVGMVTFVALTTGAW